MSHHIRSAAGGMPSEEFRKIGHELVDILADFLDSFNRRPVTRKGTPSAVRGLLGPDELPFDPSDARTILTDVARKLAEFSLHNGHPRFWGYITSSADPVGMLADLIASTVNPNLGLWSLSPVGTEIELQAIRWIADLIGFPRDCGGILVSGGTMANFVCLLAARRAKADWQINRLGPQGGPMLTVYVSTEAHTWVEKATDLFGLGSDQLRWIDVDDHQRMKVDLLEDAVSADLAAGLVPFFVVGTAGTVSTGAIDPLIDIADLCDRHRLWFHVDGAYGAFAAALPDAINDLKAIQRADSVAIDPHKWLYAPLEAGCALVRKVEDLERTFSHKSYYLHIEDDAREPETVFIERGPQNSRGFRALKVWAGLKAAGRSGVVKSIEEDIALSKHMAEVLGARPDFEVTSQDLSITTFRYVPPGIDPKLDSAYLDDLTDQIIVRLQAEGEAFVSRARVRGAVALRACIVNFRTTVSDVEALPDIVARVGASLHAESQSSTSR